MEKSVKNYLAKIGRNGGLKSRRLLPPAMAKKMVKVREARKAFRHFYTECFWSFDEHYRITVHDIEWVATQLRKHGNRSAWKVAERLCR